MPQIILTLKYYLLSYKVIFLVAPNGLGNPTLCYFLSLYYPYETTYDILSDFDQVNWAYKYVYRWLSPVAWAMHY